MSIFRKAARGILGTLLKPDSLEYIHDLEVGRKLQADPAFHESMERLSAFKDKHRGERCFIIGNGPSLNKMDLSYLKDEITFGVNKIYLLFDKLGFSTTYYVSINGLVIEQCAADIEKIKCPKFIKWEHRGYFPSAPETIFLRSRGVPGFYPDPDKEGLWEGGTVTYVNMQLAYFMGFSKVILIGVDHSFKNTDSPNKVVISEGDDTDHFDPDYFGKGFKWQLPDLETSEKAYRLAKEVYESSGRSIVDATQGGKLDIFEKVKYEEVIKKGG